MTSGASPERRRTVQAVAAEFTPDEIVEALNLAGIEPALHVVFVDFQIRYGGRADAFGLNPLIWGILHRSSNEWHSGTIEAEFDMGRWDVRCADN
jgi:hypothetical protein